MVSGSMDENGGLDMLQMSSSLSTPRMATSSGTRMLDTWQAAETSRARTSLQAKMAMGLGNERSHAEISSSRCGRQCSLF